MSDENKNSQIPNLEANFSTLILSLASSASMALGQVPHMETGKTEVDKLQAKFNIDLLLVLKEKTENNLTEEERKLLDNVLSGLQLNYIQVK